MIQLPDFLVGGSVYFEFQLVLPSDNATPVNADATPTCVVVRNGVAGSESVTIAPLSGITGGYSLTYDPAGDTEGENIIFRILATITDANFNNGEPASHRAFYATRCKAKPLRPTVAGRTLDVTAGGAAGIDWGNVENKTTINILSQTNIREAATLGAIARKSLGAVIDVWEVFDATANTIDVNFALLSKTNLARFIGCSLFVEENNDEIGQPRVITAIADAPFGLVRVTVDKPWDVIPSESNTVLIRPDVNRSEPPTVAEIQNGLATEAKQDTAKTDIDAILVDTEVTIPGLISTLRGADDDTLKTLSDQIDGIAGAGGSTTISDEDIQEIVAGVTAVAPRICDSSAGTFRMRAGDTWIQAFNVVTTGADKFIIAVKNDAADDDTAAVLLIDSVDGLERINGAVPATAGDASIATGAATITATVASNITLMIVPGKYVMTVKKLDVGSDVTPISTASLTVFAPGVSEISA